MHSFHIKPTAKKKKYLVQLSLTPVVNCKKLHEQPTVSLLWLMHKYIQDTESIIKGR